MSNQPIKNQQYIFYITLVSRATGQWQVNPTIAAGDFKVSTDGGAYNNLGTLPSVDPAGSRSVKVTLSASEMNGGNVNFQGVDAAGNEWDDVFVNFQPFLWIDANDRIDVGKVAGTAQTAGDIVADTNDIQSRLPAALSANGNMKADIKEIEDQLTSGYNATLKLKKIDIFNNDVGGICINVDAGGVNGRALYLDADGTGGTALELYSNNVALLISGHNANEAIGIYNSIGVGVYLGAKTYGVDLEATDNDALYLGSISGKSINAPQGIVGSDSQDLSVTNITDKNWDEATAGHTTAGTTGKALTDAGSAGDPWSTALPGAYGAGTAGDIIGNRLDMPISDIPTADENAETLLKKDWTTIVGEASRSILNALRKLRNKVSFDGVNTLTITKEDDATPAYTQGVVEDANQDPFKEVG